jgi:hypothetical protein
MPGKKVYVPELGNSVVFPNDWTDADISKSLIQDVIPSLALKDGKSMLHFLSSQTKLYQGQHYTDVRDDLLDQTEEIKRGGDRIADNDQRNMILRDVFSGIYPDSAPKTAEERRSLVFAIQENEGAYKQLQAVAVKRKLVLKQISQSPYFNNLSLPEIDERFTGALMPALETSIQPEPESVRPQTKAVQDWAKGAFEEAGKLSSAAEDESNWLAWFAQRGAQGALQAGGMVGEGIGKALSAIDELTRNPHTGGWEGLASVNLGYNLYHNPGKAGTEALRLLEGTVQTGFSLYPAVAKLNLFAPAATAPIKGTLRVAVPSIQDADAERWSNLIYGLASGKVLGPTVPYGVAASFATDFVTEGMVDAFDLADNEAAQTVKSLLGDVAFFAGAGARQRSLNKKEAARRLGNVEKVIMEMAKKNPERAQAFIESLEGAAKKHPELVDVLERAKQHVGEPPTVRLALGEATPKPEPEPGPGPRPRVLMAGERGIVEEQGIVLDNLITVLTGSGKKYKGANKLGVLLRRYRNRFVDDRIPLEVQRGDTFGTLAEKIDIRGQLRGILEKHGTELREFDAQNNTTTVDLIRRSLDISGTEKTQLARNVAEEGTRGETAEGPPHIFGETVDARSIRIANDIANGIILNPIDEMFRRENAGSVDRFHVGQTGRSHIKGLDDLATRIEETLTSDRQPSFDDMEMYSRNQREVDAILDYRSKRQGERVQAPTPEIIIPTDVIQGQTIARVEGGKVQNVDEPSIEPVEARTSTREAGFREIERRILESELGANQRVDLEVVRSYGKELVSEEIQRILVERSTTTPAITGAPESGQSLLNPALQVASRLASIRVNGLAMKMFGKKLDDLSGQEAIDVRYALRGEQNPYRRPQQPIRQLPTSEGQSKERSLEDAADEYLGALKRKPKE